MQRDPRGLKAGNENQVTKVRKSDGVYEPWSNNPTPIAGKILERIVIDRVRNGVDRKLRKEQAGYRLRKRTTGHVFSLRNIIKQVNEWQTSFISTLSIFKRLSILYITSLWVIIRNYGSLRRLWGS